MIDDCLKFTAYYGERQRVDGRFFADELLDHFAQNDLTTSIMVRGIAGFGLKHHLRTDQSLTLSEDPPVIAIAIDNSERVGEVAAEASKFTTRGLLTIERSRLVSETIGQLALPEQSNEAIKLTIYVGRHERVYRVPAFIAVCDLLSRRGVDGASVFVGVDGTIDGRRERANSSTAILTYRR